MKYIIYILFIACLATLSFFYSSEQRSQDSDFAVRVDGRAISTQEIDKLKQQSPSLFPKAESLPDSLIMREVLIAEALRQKVDQEEAFRHRIKTFYEQSLVKILVDRKLDSIRYTPTEEEVAAYANLQGRTLRIDLVPFDSAGQLLTDETEHLEGSFLDFSIAIRMEILFLKPEIQSPPIDLFGQVYILVVQSISEKDPKVVSVDTERDHAVIVEYRRQELFTKWQEALVKQAKIEVAPRQKELGR
jgi:hypothetical protein